MVVLFVDLECRIRNQVAKLSAKQQSLEKVLFSFVRHQFRLKRAYLPFVRIFFTKMFPYIVELQAIIDPPLVRLFESLQKRHLLRRDVPMELLVLNFKTMHLGLSAIWALEGPPWRGTSETLRKQVRLFCSGLEAK